MEILQRGRPPYAVWTGELSIDGTVIPSQFPPDYGHQQSAHTFLDAIKQIFSLTEAGTETDPGQYIRDSEGKIIFSASDPRDARLLREIDKIGMDRVTIIERS